MHEHFRLLGFRVRDVVTGFTGVVSSISFDLYGCVQAIVSPGLDKEGKSLNPQWFDTKRLEQLSRKPVMPVPTFAAIPGGEKLPQFPSNPAK